MAADRVASTDFIIGRPLSSSTATDIVSRWTSIPTYLTLFIRVFLSLRFGCCFSHQPQPTRKGRPFIMRAPDELVKDPTPPYLEQLPMTPPMPHAPHAAHQPAHH